MKVQKSVLGVLGMFLSLLLFLAVLLWAYESSSSEFVELSDHFAVKTVSRSFLHGGYNEVFLREAKEGKTRLIGTTTASHWDKPSSGPELEALEASTVAVSLDGNSLLYWHKNLRSSLGPEKEEGVYWYRVDGGERLLYKDSELQDFWHSYPRPIPKNVMVLRSPVWPTEELWALSADDASLEPLGLLGSTSLHMAVYRNDLDEVRAAVELGGAIDSQTFWGLSPLDLAVLKGYDEIAEFLVDRGAGFGLDTRRIDSAEGVQLSAMKRAVRLQRWRVIAAIRDKGGKLNDPGVFLDALYPNFYESGLISSMASGFRSEDLPAMISMILDDGADPNPEGMSVIYHLLSRGSLRGTPGQLEALRLLLERGADPGAAEPPHLSTPLHFVVSHWEWSDATKQVLDLLTPRLKSLEAKDQSGRTALQSALLQPAGADGITKAQYLVDAGADDSVEYLCGAMGRGTQKTIRQVMSEWGGEAPTHLECPGRE